jgi:Flp pilus assembly protein TadG
MLARLLRQIWRNNDGSALIEGALVIPVLFALSFGVYEFSWYFYQQQLIQTGVRDAARYMARSVDPTVANFNCNTSVASFTTAAQNLATRGTIDATGALRVNGWTTVTFACSQPATNIYAVTANTNFAEPSLGFLGFLRLPPLTIAVAHQERIIGPG